MKELLNDMRYILRNRTYQCWTFLPTLFFVLSWLTGMLSMAIFPILLTVAQFLALKKHPATIRSSLWFITLPLTYYVWIKWGPPAQLNKPDGIFDGVIAHYAAQLLACYCLLFVMSRDSVSAVFRWFGSTLIAGAIWLTLYKITVHYVGHLPPAGGFSVFIMYPLVSLIANGISGFFLLDYKATTATTS